MIAHLANSTEIRRQAIQATLDAMKSSAERNRLGQFATPNALALEIAEYVGTLLGERHPGIRFADPAVGSGSFFSAVLAAFGGKRLKSAVGIEVDPVFADAARSLWSEAGLQVVQDDFTRIVADGSVPPKPNLILANPPYVRHHHMDRADKERLRTLTYKLTGVEVNGLAGLYVYFLLIATAWMEEGGIAAWLIPSEFMDVGYGAAIKTFLTDRVTLLRIHRFDPDDVQFDDALVSSAVLVFRNAPPPTGHAVEFTFGGSLRTPHASNLISREQLRKSRKWTVYPSHAKNDRHTLGDSNGPALGDLFRIQRGIATGCNKFFILERAEARRLNLPNRYLLPILPSPRHLKSVIIDSDDDGYPAIDNPLCVIDCDVPEPLLMARHPTLWEYLRNAEVLGIRDGYLINKRNPWYKQERRDPTQFLCTYMGRGAAEKQPVRFIWNRSRAIGTNLYLMLYPRNGLAGMLRKHPERAADVFTLLRQITGHELRGEGRVYGGGLNKIEPSELARVSAAPFCMRWPELTEAIQRLETPGLFADTSNLTQQG